MRDHACGALQQTGLYYFKFVNSHFRPRPFFMSGERPTFDPNGERFKPNPAKALNRSNCQE
ncbi:protein of unknown function [Pararobbsia alpina]